MDSKTRRLRYKLLSQPHSEQLLRWLIAPMTAQQLIKETGYSQSVVYKNLRQFEEAGLIVPAGMVEGPHPPAQAWRLRKPSEGGVLLTDLDIQIHNAQAVELVSDTVRDFLATIDRAPKVASADRMRFTFRPEDHPAILGVIVKHRAACREELASEWESADGLPFTVFWLSYPGGGPQ